MQSRRRSGTVKFGERGGHGGSPYRKIVRHGKYFRIKIHVYSYRSDPFINFKTYISNIYNFVLKNILQDGLIIFFNCIRSSLIKDFP
jgi:hypothetical protein